VRGLPCSSLKETERGMSVVLRLPLFWREHGRGSRTTCLSSSGSGACLSCSMSETDLAPFRLPEKELLRESGLAWEGRGAGESLSTARRDRERTSAPPPACGPLSAADTVDEAHREALESFGTCRDRGRINRDPFAFVNLKKTLSSNSSGEMEGEC